jgi:hypothetical protein
VIKEAKFHFTDLLLLGCLSLMTINLRDQIFTITLVFSAIFVSTVDAILMT